MYIVLTLFDYGKYVPLLSLVHNKETGTSKIYKLYHHNTGLTLYEAEQNKRVVAEIFINNGALCNDFKTHLRAFDLPRELIYNVYDMACDKVPVSIDVKSSATSLINLLNQVKNTKPESWMKLLADAAVPYQHLEDVGYDYFGTNVSPNFMLDTYTGRARSLGFSIHGKNINDDLKSMDSDKNMFVHFDWISADIRFASLLSKDQELIDVFKESDPYTYIVDCLGDISREDVKGMFLAAMYNRNYTDPIFDLYPDFAAWMEKIGTQVDDGIPVHNIVGRPFVPTVDHNAKAAINATLQGSVASATHAVMRRVYELDQEILFTDIYDSVVCVCNKRQIKEVVSFLCNFIRLFTMILNYSFCK